MDKNLRGWLVACTIVLVTFIIGTTSCISQCNKQNTLSCKAAIEAKDPVAVSQTCKANQ